MLNWAKWPEASQGLVNSTSPSESDQDKIGAKLIISVTAVQPKLKYQCNQPLCLLSTLVLHFCAPGLLDTKTANILGCICNRVLWESESGDIDPWVALSQITIVQSVRTQWKGSTEQHTTATHKNSCQPRCQIWCPTLNCLSTSRWCVMCDRTIVTCHELSRAVMIVTLLPTSVNNFPGHRTEPGPRLLRIAHRMFYFPSE